MGKGQDDGDGREGAVTWARSRALGIRLAVACAAVILFMLLVAVTTSVSGHDDWEQWTHLVLLALSVIGFGVGVRGRRAGEREMVFVMLAFGAMGTAQLLLGLRVADGLDRPGLDAADVLIALWSLSLLLYLGRRLLVRDRVDGFVHLLDAGVITLALVLTLWEQVIAPSMDTAHTSSYSQLSAVLLPALGVYLAVVTLLHLLVDRSPARIVSLVGLAAIPIGDVLEISGHDPVRAIRAAAPLWIIGVACIVVSAGLPAGARLSAGRPTLSRLLIVNFFVVMALWVATWHYIIHSRPATVTSVVVGLLAGLVYGGEHVAAFLQSKQWADRLHDNVKELEVAHFELRALLDDLPEAVVVLSADGRIREANAQVTSLMGLARDEILGRTLAGLFAPSERPHLIELWNRMQSGESQFSSPVFTYELKDGTHLLLEADANVPISNPDRVVVALRNVTERLAEARRLERARERFRLAFHNAPTGMALIAVADGTLVDVNDSLVQMLGRTRYELIGCHVDDIAHPAERERSGRLLAEAIERRQEGYRTEQRFLRGDGATVWARTWVSVMADESDSLAIAHIEDITERRQNEERMQWAATHDGLTGLPNRFSFLDRLGTHLQAAEPGSVAVLFIDLDNFKVVNDSLGHDAGDQLLQAMSERLRAVVRDRDMLGRFGGDEFIVMLRDVGGNYDPYEVANRLRKEISEPVLIDGSEMFVTASIGITVFDRDGLTTSEMLRDADAAMYRAKARGRDCVEVYSPGSHDASVLTLRTTNELRRGIERGEIVPYYQPIVDLTNGNLVGFEVLARWKHPDRGLLSPEQFLPMAEETGLISEVGESVLRQSLSQLGRWRNNTKRFGDLEISVNLSVRQLADPTLVDMVSDALSEAGVSAGALWLEITETALMSDERTATNTLRELRSLGLNLSVDDFGTGYSSLTYLKRFPVKAIKVDRMFVNGLGINDDDTKIVEAVVKLGHSLGLEVIAEGVETPLQLSRLRQIDCDRGQGYLFGRPRPADLIESEYALN